MITPEDVRRAEGSYTSIPDLEAWFSTGIDETAWGRHASRLAGRSAAASDDIRHLAVEVAIRAAALQTGAIEDLYPADRGVTVSVATQAPGWEQQLEALSDDAPRLFEASFAAITY